MTELTQSQETSLDGATRHRLARLALAAARAQRERSGLLGMWDRRRLDTRMLTAVKHGFATDPEQLEAFTVYYGTLLGMLSPEFRPPAPWDTPTSSADAMAKAITLVISSWDMRLPDAADASGVSEQTISRIRSAVALLREDRARNLAEVATTTGLTPQVVAQIKEAMPIPIHAASAEH